MARKIKLLVVDDHAIVREGLVSILNFQSDFNVIGEAENGREAIQMARELEPDVIIMDLMLPDIDGAETTARIRGVLPRTKILILTSFGNSANLSFALANGAAGAITKNRPKEELFSAIRAIVNGELVVCREIQQTLREDKELPALSPRQRQILHSLARGLTNGDIARQLGISTAVIKFHILAIFRKLNVSSRSEAVALALRKQLLKL